MKLIGNEGESVSASENLLFSSASSHSSGSYECFADNGVDSQLRKIINIKVNGK